MDNIIITQRVSSLRSLTPLYTCNKHYINDCGVLTTDTCTCLGSIIIACGTISAINFVIAKLHVFLYLELDFPCRDDLKMSIPMCDAPIQWRWEKGERSSIGKPCKHVNTNKVCNVEQPAIACSDASSGACPNTLQALVNAWLQLRKISRNQK